MPQLEYFVVSESASVDKNQNTVSVFHILSRVGLESFPGDLPLLSALAAWVFSEAELSSKAEFQVRVMFEAPGAKEPKAFRTNMKATVRFQNICIQLSNVPIPAAGDFKITLFVDDVQQATHTIEISEASAP